MIAEVLTLLLILLAVGVDLRGRRRSRQGSRVDGNQTDARRL